MSTIIKSGFCKVCGETRKVSRGRANHLLHLILTILTGGLWLFVWIGIAVKFGGWRCETCGSTKVKAIR